jgi:predicted ATPase
MAAKMVSTLMMNFFHLGGVVIATSNRLLDELAKAAGHYPLIASSHSTLDRGTSRGLATNAPKLPAGSEFADFLDLLKVRCDVWQLGGELDYRRQDLDKTVGNDSEVEVRAEEELKVHPAAEGASINASGGDSALSSLPTHYVINSDLDNTDIDSVSSQEDQIIDCSFSLLPHLANKYFSPSFVQVFGRRVFIPRTHNGTALWSFNELCFERYGPADYIM